MKYAFAGDRNIAVRVLKYIQEKDYNPELLCVSLKGSHACQLMNLCPYLSHDKIFVGKEINLQVVVDALQGIDYLICVHFPYIIPKQVLEIKGLTVVNLHPAYLPYNKGWNTPTWSILDDTPYGATIHVVTERLDSGPILYQKELPKRFETADEMYKRVLELEYYVFCEWFKPLDRYPYPEVPQQGCETVHNKGALVGRQELTGRDISTITKLRALTTNNIDEAAYWWQDGKKYQITINIHETT